ncbi:MAG: hypothetical protein ABJZ55_12985 [Fuerstiella sp.]
MNLDRNKSTEKDLRSYLDDNGYFGRTAKFQLLKLTAVERPGWVQIFQFEIEAKREDSDWESLYGFCRTDERSDAFEVQMSHDALAAQQSFGEASEDMITHETAQQHSPFVGLLFIAVVVTILAAGILFYQKTRNPPVLDTESLTVPTPAAQSTI